MGTLDFKLERPKKRMLTLPEVVKYSGLSRENIMTFIWNGRLSFIRSKGLVRPRYYIDIYDLEKLIEQEKTRFTY